MLEGKIISTIRKIAEKLLNKKSDTHYDFEVDGIYYDIVSASNLLCKVTTGKRRYSGDIVIPDTVTHDGNVFKVIEIGNVFEGNKKIKSLEIGSNINHIPSNAFMNCRRLSSLVIKESEYPLHIEHNSFQPSPKKEPISRCAFFDTSLHSIYIGRNLVYKDYDIRLAPFFKLKTLKSIKFSDNVTEISRGFANSCAMLTDIDFGNGVKFIGSCAFTGCSSLKQLSLRGRIATINDFAFYKCTSVTDIVLGDCMGLIGKSAFNGCDAIERVESQSIFAPRFLESTAFSNKMYFKIAVSIPAGSKQYYRLADVWDLFTNVTEMPKQNIV